MKRLIPLLLALLLMGQDCESIPDPVNYCEATDDAFNIKLNIQASYNSIIGGTPSVDHRSTFWLKMPGKGSCTAVAIGPRTVLTAAHCRNDSPYVHEVKVTAYGGDRWTATGYLEHPDYKKYRSNPANQELRKADLMLLYFDEDLPLPSEEGRVTGIYVANPVTAALCTGLTAQGWGRTEDNPEPCPDGNAKCLREGPYTVTREEPKQLYTKHAVFEPVAICFGDSGGPLYAKVEGQPGVQLAGITSTTASMDCLVASRHTKVSAFKDWVLANHGGIGIAGTI